MLASARAKTGFGADADAGAGAGTQARAGFSDSHRGPLRSELPTLVLE